MVPTRDGDPGSAETVSISERGERIAIGSANVGALVYDNQGNEVCLVRSFGGLTVRGTEVTDDGRFILFEGTSLFEAKTPVRSLVAETSTIVAGAIVATVASAYLLMKKRSLSKTDGRVTSS